MSTLESFVLLNALAPIVVIPSLSVSFSIGDSLNAASPIVSTLLGISTSLSCVP